MLAMRNEGKAVMASMLVYSWLVKNWMKVSEFLPNLLFSYFVKFFPLVLSEQLKALEQKSARAAAAVANARAADRSVVLLQDIDESAKDPGEEKGGRGEG